MIWLYVAEAVEDSIDVILVTGAGRGIGAAIARSAGRSGWSVAVNYRRSRAEAHQVVRDVLDGGDKACAVSADVASEDDVLRMFATIDRELGPISALINNAQAISTACCASTFSGLGYARAKLFGGCQRREGAAVASS